MFGRPARGGFAPMTAYALSAWPQGAGSSSTFLKETTVKHAVVWIDQKEARIFEVDAEKVDEAFVHSPGPHIHRHANEEDLRVRNHPDDEPRYFGEVARALKEHHGQVLLVGPSMTKLHFLRYVQRHDHALEARIVGIESADHPTDAQLVAHVRQYFHESAPRRER
jgi:stalled ribosome rescue protein Dom34